MFKQGNYFKQIFRFIKENQQKRPKKKKLFI